MSSVTFTRIGLIYNPSSGRPRERHATVNRLASLLREAGREVEIFPTEGPNHASALARTAAARGFDLVVAHGGDGTMNEVLQGLMGTESVLGFWPGGTANLLAHEINFPAKVTEVVDRILKGSVKPVTVGKANDRYFLLMAGVGLDAAVSAAVNPKLKKRLGKGAFAASTLKYIWNWNLEPIRVYMDGEEVVGRFAVVGNARSYGGGFRPTPMASLTDPDLDVCIFSSVSRWDYLKFALASLRGWHPEMPGVTYRKVRRCRIESAGRYPAPVQLDGEVLGTVPLLLEAFPEAIRLLV